MGRRNRDIDQEVKIARLEERVAATRELMVEAKERVLIAVRAAEKESDRALEAQKAVNASQNEFRGAMNDQQSTYAPRDSLDRIEKAVLLLPTRGDFDGLDARISLVEKGGNFGSGRSAGMAQVREFLSWLLPMLIAALALATTLWKRG